MPKITTIEALEAIYPKAVPLAVTKVQDRLTPSYRAWINACRFVILSTVGPDGVDASPRGSEDSVVHLVDDHTLLLPDWPGNNRLDSLRNIVRDPRLSLMFMIPHQDIVVRLNGVGEVTTDDRLLPLFRRNTALPKAVIKVSLKEVYFQCPKALKHAGLWKDDAPEHHIPLLADFLGEL